MQLQTLLLICKSVSLEVDPKPCPSSLNHRAQKALCVGGGLGCSFSVAETLNPKMHLPLSQLLNRGLRVAADDTAAVAACC